MEHLEKSFSTKYDSNQVIVFLKKLLCDITDAKFCDYYVKYFFQVS